MKNEQDHFEVLRRIKKKPDFSQRELAEDLGLRMLPAFNTETGIPYGTVNLQSGVPKGETEIARTDVTKFVIQYIKQHNLQSETDKKRIIPDEKLKYLLNPTEHDVITFFNIQKFMNSHFIKK